MINFFQNFALSRVKYANFFADFFGENIFKIITSVPVAPKFENFQIKSSREGGCPDEKKN
jgi:hypothetical protein